MEKLNKAIAGLECCLDEDRSCRDSCPYFKGSYELDGCMDDMLVDALEVLKEYRRRMPCEVDGTVYHIHEDRVVAGTVYEIRIYDAEGNGFIRVDFEEEGLKNLICDLNLWGVELFPSREQAEFALYEERINDGKQ